MHLETVKTAVKKGKTNLRYRGRYPRVVKENIFQKGGHLVKHMHMKCKKRIRNKLPNKDKEVLYPVEI